MNESRKDESNINYTLATKPSQNILLTFPLSKTLKPKEISSWPPLKKGLSNATGHINFGPANGTILLSAKNNFTKNTRKIANNSQPIKNDDKMWTFKDNSTNGDEKLEECSPITPDQGEFS